MNGIRRLYDASWITRRRKDDECRCHRRHYRSDRRHSLDKVNSYLEMLVAGQDVIRLSGSYGILRSLKLVPNETFR